MKGFSPIELLTVTAFILGSISSTILANLLLKRGAMSIGIGEIWPLSIINIEIITGGIAFCLSFVLYIMVLKRLPLNLAQAIFSSQFVFVIIGARVFLNETISVTRWAGIIMITLGMLVVAYSAAVEKH